MTEIIGKYATAKVFTDNIEETAKDQIQLLCNQEFTEGCKIRIMPDVHAGKGCTIGFTADLGDKVIPALVGVDIGCGMLTVDLGKRDIDFDLLDAVIRRDVPYGFNVFPEDSENRKTLSADLIREMKCYNKLHDVSRLERSMGTLGGGNHFIEIDISDSGNKYLVIHTGSRNLGKQVAEYYQNLAFETATSDTSECAAKKAEIIKEYKTTGRQVEISAALKALNSEPRVAVEKDLCYLTDDDRDDYLHDMQLCQEFAHFNRYLIADAIIEGMFRISFGLFNDFETVHNYISPEDNIIRKGAVSAAKGERILIPINMRDGSLICIGKGNPDWNRSAPHGAGRICSRAAARERFTIDEFQNEMTGIYTTTADKSTIDECPMAYKPIDEIVKNIGDTATIVEQIKAVYNFKAAD